jgi:hypothetical protein
MENSKKAVLRALAVSHEAVHRLTEEVREIDRLLAQFSGRLMALRRQHELDPSELVEAHFEAYSDDDLVMLSEAGIEAARELAPLACTCALSLLNAFPDEPPALACPVHGGRERRNVVELDTRRL